MSEHRRAARGPVGSLRNRASDFVGCRCGAHRSDEARLIAARASARRQREERGQK